MITFKCDCGKMLRVKEEVAGKRVRCPACKAVVQVPVPQAKAAPAAPAPAPEPSGGLELKLMTDSPPEPAPKAAAAPKPEAEGADFGLQEHKPEQGEHEVKGEGKHCPACHMLLPAASVICTTCGHDYRTGKVFEQPKTVMERIPWKTISKVAVQLAMLAIVAAMGWWAYTKVRATRNAEPEPEEGKPPAASPGKEPAVRGTRRQLDKRAYYIKHKPALRVVYSAEDIGPTPPGELQIRFADGAQSVANARSALLSRISAEARDKMRIVGHTVIKPRGSKPLGASEELKLLVELKLGWVYQQSGGKLVPTQPYVAFGAARILRKKDGREVAVWKSQGTYKAKRPGAAAAESDAQAVAKLQDADVPESPAKLADLAGSLARSTISAVFNVVPPPNFLAKLLAENREVKN
jgi:phage FluMu protein Com